MVFEHFVGSFVRLIGPGFPAHERLFERGGRRRAPFTRSFSVITSAHATG